MSERCISLGWWLRLMGTGCRRFHLLRVWEAWQETAYLFRSPANARRLLDAAAALDAGQGVQIELDAAE